MTGQGPMARAVAAAVKDAQPAARDAAAVALVRRYAQLLDAARDTDVEAQVVADLGPKLLAALGALGMTLAGRGAKGGAEGGSVGGGKLDELRARRARRAGAG